MWSAGLLTPPGTDIQMAMSAFALVSSAIPPAGDVPGVVTDFAYWSNPDIAVDGEGA
jgi:hypothetical protein